MEVGGRASALGLLILPRRHSTPPPPRCLGVCRVLKWTNLQVPGFPLFFLGEQSSVQSLSHGSRLLANTGTPGYVIKRSRSAFNHPPSHIGSTGAIMAFWSAGNRTPSPGSDMETDYSDDRTPSPYSDDDSKPLWVDTPLVHSRPISDRLGFNVYLKMEVKQQSSPLNRITNVKPAS